MLLGDSQKYPLAVQQLHALSGSQGEDNRKARKVDGNSAGMGSKYSYFNDICTQIAFNAERECWLAFARSELASAARQYACGEIVGRDYQARSSLAPGASMRMSAGIVALVSSNLRVV